MKDRRDRLFAATSKALAAATAAGQSKEPVKLAELAKRFDVEESSLAAWFYYLGIGTDAVVKLDHFTKTERGLSGYEFVSGWGQSGGAVDRRQLVRPGGADSRQHEAARRVRASLADVKCRVSAGKAP